MPLQQCGHLLPLAMLRAVFNLLASVTLSPAAAHDE